jgi:hypothetical protein
MTTCCTPTANARESFSEMMGCSGRPACAHSAMKNAKATRPRAGMDFADKTGALVNSANTRKKGQKMGVTQAMICASVKPIMCLTVQAAKVGMDCSVRRM